jgi:hypothetical protein
MATEEKDVRATLAELKELAKDPEKRKEMADFGKLESVLEELMPWEDGAKPGYDKAALFAANKCSRWLSTLGYCAQMMALGGPDQSVWLDRALVCAEEYEACIEI